MYGTKNRTNNVREREVNKDIRSKYKGKLEKTNSYLSGGIDFMEMLRVSTNDRESPFNRTKLFTLGKQGSGKEALLSALFDVDLQEETSYEMKPIVLGKYDAETFAKVENNNIRRPIMEVWNYSRKAVFNYLQDLYMTDCTLYMFAFDMKTVIGEDDDARNETLNYLKNLLHSKKLLAPTAPVYLVGTNGGGLSEEDKKDCNDILFQEVLGGGNFNVKLLGPGVHYAAVCCDSGKGIEHLKASISGTLRTATYITEHVPKTLHDAERVLKESGMAYMKYSDVRRLFRKIDIKDDDVCEVVLKILADRGIITFVHKYESLRKFVVIKPEWLIQACGVAIYYDGKHKVLDYDFNDTEISNDFNKFVYQRVLTKRLLCHVLKRMDYDEEVHDYIVDLMKSTCMVADYLFDDVDSYLTPTFFDNLKGRNVVRKDVFNEQMYSGPYFILDFSGKHSNEIVNDGGQVYSTFMPFSYFEKLVSLAIQLSASFGRGVQPITRYKKARLSFGSEVDFMLSVLEEANGRPLKIKISTLVNTSQDKANDLLERLYSMARGIRNDFYPGVTDKVNPSLSSKLALSLLVPAKDNEQKHLASYEEILTAKDRQVNVIPNFTTAGSVPTDEYDQWFRNGAPLQVGAKIKYIPKQADGGYPVPEGKKHHCMLSYKETSALDVVERQLNDLRRLGYTCWLNKEYEGELTLDVYRQAVRDAMCFILVLSVDVFESKLILEELNVAIQENVPIIFLHHPDTDKLGYWAFSQYIATCPTDLRHLFNEIESIKLQTRFYLQEAVTNKLIRKIRAIMTGDQDGN